MTSKRDPKRHQAGILGSASDIVLTSIERLSPSRRKTAQSVPSLRRAASVPTARPSRVVACPLVPSCPFPKHRDSRRIRHPTRTPRSRKERAGGLAARRPPTVLVPRYLLRYPDECICPSSANVRMSTTSCFMSELHTSSSLSSIVCRTKYARPTSHKYGTRKERRNKKKERERGGVLIVVVPFCVHQRNRCPSLVVLISGRKRCDFGVSCTPRITGISKQAFFRSRTSLTLRVHSSSF